MTISSDQFYKLYIDYSLTPKNNNDLCFLGDANHRVCRFCGLSEPDVTFKKRAHAISESLGNTKLFSYYECDECNQKFSKYESNTANFFHIYRASLGLRGKTGLPKIDNDILIKTDFNKNNINIKSSDTINLLKSKKVNLTENELSLCENVTYIPLLIYKHLLKMALTIMPEEHIHKFDIFLGKDNILYNIDHDISGTQRYLYTHILKKPITDNHVKLYKLRDCSHISKNPMFSSLPKFLFALEYHHLVLYLYLLEDIIDEPNLSNYLPHPNNYWKVTMLNISYNTPERKLQEMKASFSNPIIHDKK